AEIAHVIAQIDDRMIYGGARLDFLYWASGAVGAVGLTAAAWPFVDQMNPSTAALALASTEVELGAVQPGQQVIVKWRGHPLFVRRRTPAEIEAAKAVDVASLPDPLANNNCLPEGAPAPDANRATKPEWLILIGVCTHLGCTPTVSTPQMPEGDYGGWVLHLHGSVDEPEAGTRQSAAPPRPATHAS